MSAPENNAPIPGAADYAIALIRQGREEGAAIVEAAHRYTASSEVVRSAVRARLHGRYEIHFSPARARRAMKPFAVMEIVDSRFSRGISQHSTKEEAESAMAELNAKERE